MGYALVAAALTLVSCRNSDSRAMTDSELLRDLALANRVDVVPQLADTAPTTASKPVATKASPALDRPAQPPAHITERPESPPVAPTMKPDAPAAAAVPTFRGIPAGATFALTTKAALCTTNLPGDKITATITGDVIGENGAVIPTGSTVVLEVALVTPGDTPEAATLSLRIRSVIVNDQPIAVPSDVTITSQLERRTMPRDKGADRRKVIGGVVAGAIVGQIMGKDTKSTVTGAVIGGATGAAAAAASTKYDACLPAGGALRATTREPVPLTATQ